MGSEIHLVKDKDDLKSKLKAAADKLVVVDFYADWCGPCKMIAPKLEEWAVAMPNVVFLKVNIDECEDVASEFDVVSLPTFILFKNFKNVDQVTGANDGKLKALIDKYQ